MLFDRAGEETREAYETLLVDQDHQSAESKEYLELTYARHEHIPSFLAWEPNQYQSRGLTEPDISAWWESVTDPEFVGPCVMQWAAAWAGGAAQSGMDQKMRFEDLRDFLLHYEHGLWRGDFVP
jgi:hypothetical protein